MVFQYGYKPFTINDDANTIWVPSLTQDPSGGTATIGALVAANIIAVASGVTLAAQATAGDTSVTVSSGTGIEVGMEITLGAAGTAQHTTIVTGVVGAVVSLRSKVQVTVPNGAAVQAYWAARPGIVKSLHLLEAGGDSTGVTISIYDARLVTTLTPAAADLVWAGQLDRGAAPREWMENFPEVRCDKGCQILQSGLAPNERVRVMWRGRGAGKVVIPIDNTGSSRLF